VFIEKVAKESEESGDGGESQGKAPEKDQGAMGALVLRRSER
jgi:hypothetical protein